MVKVKPRKQLAFMAVQVVQESLVKQAFWVSLVLLLSCCLVVYLFTATPSIVLQERLLKQELKNLEYEPMLGLNLKKKQLIELKIIQLERNRIQELRKKLEQEYESIKSRPNQD